MFSTRVRANISDIIIGSEKAFYRDHMTVKSHSAITRSCANPKQTKAEHLPVFDKCFVRRPIITDVIIDTGASLSKHDSPMCSIVLTKRLDIIDYARHQSGLMFWTSQRPKAQFLRPNYLEAQHAKAYHQASNPLRLNEDT